MVNDDTSADTIVRKPYNSGNSKVMTISGVPPLSVTDQIITKKVELDGKECVVCFPYEEFSKYEVENMANEIEISDSQ